MRVANVLRENEYILAEGSIYERICREESVEIDPYISYASLIYDKEGREILRKMYKEYMDIGYKYNCPMIDLTPTWRTNIQRVEAAGFDINNINTDCVCFLDELRKEYGDYASKILIGGLMGCKGDAYKPKDSLSFEDAFEFHKPQAYALAKAGVDFLIAETLPAIEEALGIAKAMAETNCEYIISFVIRPDCTVLDGTLLQDAIERIDSIISPKPICYMVNCVHSSILDSALNKYSNCDILNQRLLGIQSNTSAKSPEELDGSIELEIEEPRLYAQSVVQLYHNHHIKILGGCCGSNKKHIEQIAQLLCK